HRLAKARVASSNLVFRSILDFSRQSFGFFLLVKNRPSNVDRQTLDGRFFIFHSLIDQYKD
ncbi:MAG: hypothetical protein RRY37_07785, partial [Eubacterium sp.]